MNYEYDRKERGSEDEAGYSEKQLDIDAEIQAGEWQNLKKYRTYQRRSRQWKIIATYKAISNRLNQLVNLYYKLVGGNPKQGEKMLKELRKLRLMQEILLQCMVWEPKGQLDKDMVPKEVWDLIK
jgi:hypothetical protein